jgi:hypothetical protein
MKTTYFLFVTGWMFALLAGWARAEGGGPAVTHAPVSTAVRGVPVHITATIEAATGAPVTSAVVLVRLTDAGTPIRTTMNRGGDGAYTAILPVSMFRSVSVFWYAIDARDAQGEVGGTPWMRVVIADPMTQEGGGGAAAAGVNWKKAGLIGGGLLAAGGAVAIIAAQDDDDDSSPAPTGTTPPPKNTSPPPSSSGGDEPPDLSGLTNVICQTTGRETVSYENLSRCEGLADILIRVCFTCVNADIRATASWQEEDIITGFSNVRCSTSVPVLRIRKPPTAFPTPGSETINVYVNDVLVDSVVWPPLSDLDCF